MRTYKLLPVILMLAFATNLNAQFTMRIAGGYAGPGLQNTEGVLAPDINPAAPTVDALSNMANVNDTAHTYKAVHGSYGTGGNVTLGLGYMFNKFIGIDVGITYGHSNTITCNEIISLPQPLTGVINATINTFAWAVGVSPTVVITGEKTGWKVYPYARLGFSLPVAGKLTDNVSILAPTQYDLNYNGFGWLGAKTDIQLQTTATVSLGLNGTVGVAYRALPFMNVFAEVGFQYLNVRGKSSTVTKWTATVDSGGTTQVVNDIPLRSKYRDQFNYIDQLTSSSNNAQYNPTGVNYNQPKQDTRPVVPASSLGFNVGLTFFLSKKTLGKSKDKNGSSSASTGK
jgi:hypothetical protein